MAVTRPPRSGLAFRAIPNDLTVRGRIGPEGVPIFQWPGELDLPALRDPAMARVWREHLHDPRLRLEMPPRVDAVVNLCASVEHYSKSLMALDAALRPDVPVLNHPRAVMMTRRDVACGVLAQIPFLQVPKTLRFLPEAPRDFMTTFDKGGMQYPVILQPAAAEEGLERYEIAHPGGWAQLFQAPWAGRFWIMTQGTQGRSPWRLRIGIAGNSAHVERYLDGPAPDGKPPAVQGEFIGALIKAVRGCIPLDVATVVLALEPHRPLLERFDAGLPVPQTDGAPEALGLASRRVCTALAEPLAALLRDTVLWRNDASRLAAIVPPPADSRSQGA